MEPTVTKAIKNWNSAYDQLQECAVNALSVALPGISPTKTPAYCCPVTLVIDEPNVIGEGRICVDDDTRATIELEQVPNGVIAEAVDALFGIAWFDGADGPLGDAGPGTYYYDDEMTRAEYEVILGEQGVGRVYVACVPVPYAVELLDAMTAARLRQAGDPSSTLAPER